MTDGMPASTDTTRFGERLIGHIGASTFAADVLDHLQSIGDIHCWTAYRLHPSDKPQLELCSTYGSPEVQKLCWDAYAAGIYRRDRSFDGARRALGLRQPAACTLMHPKTLHAEHRARIYDEHQFLERYSVVCDDGSERGALLAINLYRMQTQTPFRPSEIAGVQANAGVLAAAVRRHLELNRSLSSRRSGTADARSALRSLCGSLTAREVDVCAALLGGLTHEGVAAELGVSAATVKTYRDRAFRRLGIHHRHELFSRVAGVERDWRHAS